MIGELFIKILEVLFVAALVLGAMIIVMMLDIRRIVKSKETIS